MKYEIVNLEEKIIVGLNTTTSNDSPDVCEKISGLWGSFLQGGVSEKINNIKNEYTIGLYSDYNESGKYQVTVGNEVTKSENEELTTKVIPAGKYAKFSVHGHMVTAVNEAWTKIWAMKELDRSFTGDFEEYLTKNLENADIDIYIAIK